VPSPVRPGQSCDSPRRLPVNRGHQTRSRRLQADYLVAVLRGLGNGRLQRPVGYTADGGPFAVAITDLNAHPDIVTGNPGPDDAYVMRGDGTGRFAAAVDYRPRGRRLDRDLGPQRRPTPRSRSCDISAEMASPSALAEAAVKFDKCAATTLINIPSRSQPAISGQTGRWISWLQRELQRPLRAAAAAGAPPQIQGTRNAEKGDQASASDRLPSRGAPGDSLAPVCRRLGCQRSTDVSWAYSGVTMSWDLRHRRSSLVVRLLLAVWITVVVVVLCATGRWWGLVFVVPLVLDLYLFRRILAAGSGR
jgi:hypothetical protein